MTSDMLILTFNLNKPLCMTPLLTMRNIALYPSLLFPHPTLASYHVLWKGLLRCAHSPISFRLASVFPSELWLRFALYLTHTDLLSLRRVTRSFSLLFTHLTHRGLVLRFPAYRYNSLSRHDICTYIANTEVAIAAFLVRYNLRDVVKRVTFDSWPFDGNPLFFPAHLNSVEHVVYCGTDRHRICIPPTHVLPSSIIQLEITYMHLGFHSLHHLLGPSPSLQRLEMFACEGGGLYPISLSSSFERATVVHWLDENGLHPSGTAYSEALTWSSAPRPTLLRLVLDCTCSLPGFNVHVPSLVDALRATSEGGTVRFEDLMPAGLTFPHRLSLSSLTSLTLALLTPDLPSMPAILAQCRHFLTTLRLTLKYLYCYHNTLVDMVYVIRSMCFSQPLAVHLFLHPPEIPVIGDIDLLTDRYHESLPDVPVLPFMLDMWLPNMSNRSTPFTGVIIVDHPCTRVSCEHCPGVLDTLVDLLNKRYPSLPGRASVFRGRRLSTCGSA
ncbi:hypothetical protein BDZ89DRAFT_1138722 [Hymenopellis radicata]|nr:hypothetical protein BDZ89DRAFT_1138722 [Hymenopellis radicata]